MIAIFVIVPKECLILLLFFDKDAGNPISEDEMNKLLESVPI